jgi:hypothetical protein
MPYFEADTRATLITPAIHKRGYTEDLNRQGTSFRDCRDVTCAMAHAGNDAQGYEGHHETY